MRISSDLAKAKIIILTGAGASVPLGLPDTRTFLSRVVDSPSLNSLGGERGGVERVGDLRRCASVRTDLDIERVLSDVDRLLDGLDPLPTDTIFGRHVP